MKMGHLTLFVLNVKIKVNEMAKCVNCFNNGSLVSVVDRGDHEWCPKCGRRQEKEEPVKQYVFDTNPWDTEVKW